MDKESRHQEEQEQEETEQEERHRRREEIIGAMDIIPIDMDFNDGYVLLSLLYTIRKQIGQRSRSSLADFWDWFVDNYETDSNEGRITSLQLVAGKEYDDDGEDDDRDDDRDEVPYFFISDYNLPPIIERLQKLKDSE